MKIVLCTSNLIGAVLIRAVTWSKWSHAAVLDGDTVIEAGINGVVETPLADIVSSHTETIVIDFPSVDSDKAIAAARSQIGKPYDYTAILGLLVHRNWQEQDSWFCSELVAWSAEQAGTPLFRTDSVNRVTPQHLWMVSPR